MLVVAAVLLKGQSVLICRRPFHKTHGGKWEFPGGKVEATETLHDALERELLEELNLQKVKIQKELFRKSEENFEIVFFEVESSSQPQMLEHEELAWVPISELVKWDLAPSDSEFASQFAAAHK